MIKNSRSGSENNIFYPTIGKKEGFVGHPLNNKVHFTQNSTYEKAIVARGNLMLGHY